LLPKLDDPFRPCTTDPQWTSQRGQPALLCNRVMSVIIDLEGLEIGAEGQNRTADTMIFSHVLYQLSYLGARGRWQDFRL
jgi:hypothetical protein